MSKQINEGEEAVPVPTSFEVNHDEQWAADHTEFESKFVSYVTSTSEESDGDILNNMYPDFESEETADDVDEQPVINDGLVLDDYSDSEDAADEQPVAAADEVVLSRHVNELGLPANVNEDLPGVNTDGLVLPEVNSDGVISVPEDEEEMMSVVSDLGGELISEMAEKTVKRTGAALAIATMSISKTFEELNAKFDEVNDDATAILFPEPQDDLPEPTKDRVTSFVEEKPFTPPGDSVFADSVTTGDSTSAADSVTAADSGTATDSVSDPSFGETISVGTSGTYESTWSKMVLEKIMRRKYQQEESVMTPITDVEESREESQEPEESLETEEEREGNDDDGGVWSFMNVCGGLKQSIESTTDRVTDYVFPYNGVDLIAELQAEEEAKLAAAAALAAEQEAYLNETQHHKEKKSFKDRIKGGKMKNLFRRRRSAKKQCELLA